MLVFKFYYYWHPVSYLVIRQTFVGHLLWSGHCAEFLGYFFKKYFAAHRYVLLGKYKSLINIKGVLNSYTIFLVCC